MMPDYPPWIPPAHMYVTRSYRRELAVDNEYLLTRFVIYDALYRSRVRYQLPDDMIRLMEGLRIGYKLVELRTMKIRFARGLLEADARAYRDRLDAIFRQDANAFAGQDFSWYVAQMPPAL